MLLLNRVALALAPAESRCLGPVAELRAEALVPFGRYKRVFCVNPRTAPGGTVQAFCSPAVRPHTCLNRKQAQIKLTLGRAVLLVLRGSFRHRPDSISVRRLHFRSAEPGASLVATAPPSGLDEHKRSLQKNAGKNH